MEQCVSSWVNKLVARIFGLGFFNNLKPFSGQRQDILGSRALTPPKCVKMPNLI